MRIGFNVLNAIVVGLVFCVSSVVAQHDHGAKSSPEKPRRDDVRRSSQQLEGLRENPPRRFAIVGAMVHASPNSQPNIETILIDGTKIVAIGEDVNIPPGTKTIDGTGKHCYAGFIDSYTGQNVELDNSKGTGYWNDQIRPQLSIADDLNVSDFKVKGLRDAGFTAALVAPSSGIIQGQSSLLLLSDYKTEHLILRQNVAQHLKLTASRGRDGYPNSPMGAVALARQAMYDAQWYQKAWQVVKADASVEQPETNSSLKALSSAISGDQTVVVETSNELFVGRADRFAREFGLKLAVLGNGNEYRRLDEIADYNRTIILPLDFPKPPDVSSAEKAADVTLEDMMHWDHAPENPARLVAKDVNIVFTTKGIKNKKDFLENLRKAVNRGLPKNAALASLTTNSAEFFGVEDQIGTLEKNKIANITMTDGDLFEDKTKIVETWVDGVRFEAKPAPVRDVEGTWELKAKGSFGKSLSEKYLVVKSGHGISGKFVDKSEIGKTSADNKKQSKDAKNSSEEPENSSIQIKPIGLAGTRLTGAFRSDDLGEQGISLFSLVTSSSGTGIGQVTLPDGVSVPITAKLLPNKDPDPDEQWDELSKHDDVAHANGKHKGLKEEALKSEAKKKKTVAASFPVNFPLGAFGRESAPGQPKSVLIKNVTVWTLDEREKIEGGAVLFGSGWIQSVYDAESELPDADLVIDGKGGHVTPGIIDCHSHMASDSGINESGQAITAEVRIGDMIDCDDISIYHQLAGGVTAANVLHGSANPIGGQNQVIKLRWGASEQETKFEGAPLGIKFALGENVKQSNWSNPTNRYPQTRMGVEQIMDDALRAAKDYGASVARYKKTGKGMPPRRDLELDALLEIVNGERWVHCHSYRQDEILALIRTLDRHNITIGSFQHILEGYKVADEMAEHGAMASAFADWWAYKYEVKDAIPFAGALMHRAGVVVSFNSDDGELGRHLNQEAAKAVRYGGVSEVEALKFVTLNPARQLRIEERVGSIEVGKDADLVLWTKHPLSNLSTVKQTWVDGRKYFDRQNDLEQQKRNREMRLALIQKILESGEEMQEKTKSNSDPAKLWPRHDEFCHGHGHDHGE